MEAILPFKIKNEQKFYESALKVGYNEMEAYKFIYVMQHSDLDIFPKMHDERINILIYGWEICEDYKQKLNPNEWELPDEMETILKLLVPWSMDIWFSKEWDKCKYLLKSALIHCLNRARDLLMRMPDMMQINWDFLLLYNLKPWNVLYLKNLTVTKEKTLENGAQSIETEELPATDDDISYVKLEQLPIIVLRLVKIFDQSSVDMVKTLCMRVIAAWNKIHQTELATSGSRRPYIPPEDKRCLMLICHVYLMAVYESDDVKGYVIDNMIHNIRFYYQGFQNAAPLHAMDNLEYTPARYIALTNIHLRVQKRDFFDFFIWNKYDTTLVNLFGAVSQAYKSYLLGNLLMELNNMNEDDFASNIPLYKRLMNSYVNERERSELFLINELDKTEAQRYAHNIIQTVQNVTDFKSKICKGNRMSNIGNYENSDDTVTPLADPKNENINPDVKVGNVKEEVIAEDAEDEQERVRIKESELRLDPIFQNLPNNESILYYVYDVLAKKDYKGWHFAKIVLLVKIIDHEQNMIETWRYHPGLTTDFMLNLELKLSHHYVDLAKIFKDHPFIEQEFWLTAFYLNPTSELYESVKRLGMRNNRKRTDEHTKLVMSIDNIEAKYGLLSSTIDVKELATMSNNDDPVTDYDPLFSALHSLRVPDSLVKDMLTAIFLPRNRSFAWAVDWVILRNRCKMIMTSSKEKKRFVDLNMAEANERLKYLIIDYEKYKNRPQLDYGTIEEGYENLMTSGEFDKVSEDEEEDEEEEEDFEDDEDVYESKRRGRGSLTAAARKKEAEKIEDDNSQEDDPFLMGKRRTRARTAATLASFLFQTLPRASRRKRNQKPPEEETKLDEEKISADTDDKSSDSKSPITTSASPIPSLFADISDEKDIQIANMPIKNIKECLKERPMFFNTTQGFPNLIDIWDVEKSDLQSIDENCVSLMESNSALQIAAKLKLLYKEINPLGCDEKEYIDDIEMIIHNAEYVIKKERDLNAVKEEDISVVEEMKNIEGDAMLKEVEEIEENVEKDILKEKIAEVEEVAVFMDIDEDEKNVKIERVVEQTANIEEAAVFVEEYENTNFVEKVLIIEQTANTEKDAVFVKADDNEKTVESDRCLEQTGNIEEDAAETDRSIEQPGNIKEDAAVFGDVDENIEYERIIEQPTNKEEPGELREVNDNAKNVEIDKIDQTTNIKEILEFAEVENNEQNFENGSLAQTTNIEMVAEFVEADDNEKNVGNNVDNVEILEEFDLQVPEETPVEKDLTEHEANETDQNKQLQSSEDNSSESINSDMSTAAIKVSREINESNTENSKRYSATVDSEMNEQIIQNKDLKAESQTEIEQKESTDIEPKKSIEEQQIRAKTNPENEQNKSCKEKDDALQEENKVDNKNKADESITDEQASHDSHIEITEERKETYDTTENDETAMEHINDDADKNKDLISDKTLEELAVVQDEIANELEKLTDIDKELNNAEEMSQEPIENLKELKENSCEKTQLVDLQSTNDKESENLQVANDSEEILMHKDESLREETNKSNTESLDNLENAAEDKQSKEIKACIKTLEEDTQSKSVAIDSVETNNSNQEPTANIIETHHKEDALVSTKPTALDDKDSLSELQNNESNIILHYSTSEELNETDTKANQTKLEKIAEDATTDQEKLEITDCTKAVEAISDQTEFATTDDNKNSYTPSLFFDDTTADSIKTTEDKQSTDGETNNLTNLCLTKNVQILLRRLRPQDLINLRQPKVKIQRMSFEKYAAEFRAKRRRVEGKVYLEFEDSSNSNSYGTNTSSSEPYRPTRLKRKIPIIRRHSVRQLRTSESENDSNNSDDFKLSTIMAKSRKRRLSTPSTSQNYKSQQATGPKSARKTGPKSTRRTTGPKSSKQNLVVTPRSASGLKLRISNAEQNRQQTGLQNTKTMVFDEIIQLSSSSSDAYGLNDLTMIEEEVIEIEDHPLFEEEIII